MVEQGLALYLQGQLAALAPPVVAVGPFFAAQISKDGLSATTPMAFGYRSILENPNYTLKGRGVCEWEVQIDCYGNSAANAITLADAIQGILDKGFRGTFSDPDTILVESIARIDGPKIDGFIDSNRTYVRSLEYAITYHAPL